MNTLFVARVVCQWKLDPKGERERDAHGEKDVGHKEDLVRHFSQQRLDGQEEEQSETQSRDDTPLPVR